MKRLRESRSAERLLLSAAALVCYSATLSLLVALCYALGALALSAAGHTAAAGNFDLPAGH